MQRDSSSCNTYNYSDSLHWDERYLKDVGSFDWYQQYSSLRPFIRQYIPTSSTVLMVGCGNALMSEDMVKDGYDDIMNVDILPVAIGMMRKKHECVPQLKYMQMDVRDMSFFRDESFGGVINKGTLDALMCGDDASTSATKMLWEVNRILKPGGIYMLVARPGFERPAGSSLCSCLEPVHVTESGLLPAEFVIEDPDSRFIYVCKKMNEATVVRNISAHH